jgi:hypothetical protein
MKLKQADIDTIAQRANFFFNITWAYHTFDESVVYTGDGVDDLDRLIVQMAAGTRPSAQFQVDVGMQYSIYKPFDLDDLVAIRAAYVAFYGAVNKPNAYLPERSSNIQVPQTAVAVSSGATNVAE